MTSNDGTTIAINTITTVTPMRNVYCRSRVSTFDWLNLFGLIVAARGSMRNITSNVLTMGEQLHRLSAVYSALQVLGIYTLQRKFCQRYNGHKDQHNYADCLRILLSGQQVRTDFVFRPASVHEISGYRHCKIDGSLEVEKLACLKLFGGARTHNEAKDDIERLAISVWVSHVS
jgi:hypothetical protein